MHVRAAVPHALAAASRSHVAADPHPELDVLPTSIVREAAQSVAVALAEWDLGSLDGVGLAKWLRTVDAELRFRACDAQR